MFSSLYLMLLVKVYVCLRSRYLNILDQQPRKNNSQWNAHSEAERNVVEWSVTQCSETESYDDVRLQGEGYSKYTAIQDREIDFISLHP